MVGKLIVSFWRVVSRLVTADNNKVAAAGVGGRGVPKSSKRREGHFLRINKTPGKDKRNLAIMVVGRMVCILCLKTWQVP